MKKSLNTKQYGGLSPYCTVIPPLKRPTEGSLNRPKNKEERLYCWFFWIEAILNPELTRAVLDELHLLPEFIVEWGPDFYEGKRLKDRTEELTINPPKKFYFKG
jgi:hypothetical protein